MGLVIGIFCLFLGNMEFSDATMKGVLFALFCGALARVFFTFVAEMILNGVDIMMFCFALEIEGHLGHQDRFSELNKLIKEHVKDGVVEGDEQIVQGKIVPPEATATGTATG